MYRNWPHLTLIVLAVIAFGQAVRAGEPGTIELLCLDEQVIHGATFQSHNQKVVFNDRGIFVAYVQSRNADYTAQNWHVLRSRDRGRTFARVASGVAATNPPVLETDADSNLYLGRVDWVAGNAQLGTLPCR